MLSVIGEPQRRFALGELRYGTGREAYRPGPYRPKSQEHYVLQISRHDLIGIPWFTSAYQVRKFCNGHALMR